jgi:hypothetical protein
LADRQQREYQLTKVAIFLVNPNRPIARPRRANIDPAGTDVTFVILRTKGIPAIPRQVLADWFVIRDEVQAFSHRLSNQDSVERISVQQRERRQRRHVTRANTETSMLTACSL